MQGIYCIEHPNGIKIGWSDGIDKRISSHMTSGASIKVFAKLECKNKNIDECLRKILFELGLRVPVIDNPQTTEVYKLSRQQTEKILDYIRSTGEITKEFIIDLINGKDEPENTEVSYLEIRNLYGSRYKRPNYQRDVDKEHVDNIKKYIETNHGHRNFYLPPILLTKESKDDDKFIIIDGQHRCAAICEINKLHPCMSKKIPVTIYPVLPMAQQIALFKNVNSSKPMPVIKIADNYMELIKNKVIQLLNFKYGMDLVNKNAVLYNTIFCDGALNKLFDEDVITDISDRMITGLLVELNERLTDGINRVVERVNYLKIAADSKSKDDDETNKLILYLSDVTSIRSVGLQKLIKQIREKRKYKKFGKLYTRSAYALKLLEGINFIEVYKFIADNENN